MEWLNDVTLRAGAGVTCAKVARVTAKQGLTGAEFLAGIPGSLGGALAMNAGAFGGETWDHVAAVETIDRTGRLHTRLPEEYRVAYRTVEGVADEWFVAARLSLQHGDSDVHSQRYASCWQSVPQHNRQTSTAVARCSAIRPGIMPRD